MSPASQKKLALAAAAIGVALFVAANAHLVAAAFQSQPECVARESGMMPARKAC